MTTLLIKNGLVIDPANKINKTANVFIKDGKIVSVGTKAPKADKTINAKGLVVTPGLIDMHVHLREPGKEDEETIASGSAAAINGGFTSVACMPNTDPPVDNEASAEFVYIQAKRSGKANVFPIGAVTKGRKGEELAEIGQLARGGAVAFSDDGDPVASAEVMRRGLEYSSMFNKAIIAHCENKTLIKEGVMNEGYISTLLGLPGIPAVAEEIMVYRDIALARLTGGKLHIAHISTAEAVNLVANAKKEGLKVTAEVTPHHFTLTDDAIKTPRFGGDGFNTNFKMNPPLRTEEDRQALLDGLKNGTIDVIASDHAPHSPEKKDVEFSVAPFGVIGLETVLPIMLTELVHKKILSLSEAIAKVTVNPARILGIPKGTLSPGADADITIINLNKEWTINPEEFKSKSRNCPFAGWKVKGKTVQVIIAGQPVSAN
ncbi:MAG: dihydroorotase [Planctomycetes bacterium]|nr:dihydroorotase [Planctomycetota bacterium]